jgi:hypothetical protein
MTRQTPTTTNNVVEVFGAVVPRQANTLVVGTLRRQLRRAERGEIVAIGLAGVSANNQAFTEYVGQGDSGMQLLCTAANVLNQRVIKAISE